MKKTALALGLFMSPAFVPAAAPEARADVTHWREFEYHWTIVDGDRKTQAHMKYIFREDGTWEGDMNLDQWPCQLNKDTCSVGGIIAVKAHDGHWTRLIASGDASKTTGFHWHRQGKNDEVKKHFASFHDQNAKGEFTTTSDYRWKTYGVHHVDWKEIEQDVVTGLKIGATIASFLCP